MQLLLSVSMRAILRVYAVIIVGRNMGKVQVSCRTAEMVGRMACRIAQSKALCNVQGVVIGLLLKSQKRPFV